MRQAGEQAGDKIQEGASVADDKIQQAAQQVQERAVPAVKDITDGTVRPGADKIAAEVQGLPSIPSPPVAVLSCISRS